MIPGTGNAAGGGIRDCLMIAKDQERLRCYDDLANKQVIAEQGSSGPMVAASPPARVEASPLGDTSALPARAPRAAAASPAQEVVRGKKRRGFFGRIANFFSASDEDAIRSRIVQVRTDPRGRKVLTLANGEVWRQIDNEPLDVKDGEEVYALLYEQSFGSHLLKLEGRGQSAKVKRIDNKQG